MNVHTHMYVFAVAGWVLWRGVRRGMDTSFIEVYWWLLCDRMVTACGTCIWCKGLKCKHLAIGVTKDQIKDRWHTWSYSTAKWSQHTIYTHRCDNRYIRQIMIQVWAWAVKQSDDVERHRNVCWFQLYS